jgi:fibronectin type 3 domain-containing protein
VIGALCIADVNSVPVIDTLRVIQNKMVNISWRMSDPNEAKLPTKYLLFRSERENSGYKIIYESSNSSNYLDKNITTGQYYKVVAVLKNNDSLISFSRYATIIDTIAPASPSYLRATVDKKGIVSLSWKKNTEADIQGYKLFRSNRLQDEFVQINEKFVTDTISSDKLNLKTLSKKIYYKIAASDNNFNTSVLSEAIEVMRPDTIPPQPPLLISVSQITNGLIVKYILSNSEDIGKEVLLKRGSTDLDFKEFYSFSKKDSIGELLDTITEPGQTYIYKLCSTDEDGNRSYSRTVDFLYETGFRKKIKDITFTVDRTAKKIDLVWKYDEKNVEKFVIYRSKKNEKPTIIKTLEGSTLQFTDKTVSIGNIYEYRIKAALANGAESIISSPVNVEY